MSWQAQWHKLNNREQRLISIMGAAIIACLWWFLLLSPLLQANRNLQVTRNQQQQLLPWMAKSVATLEQLPKADTSAQQAPLQLINTSLQRPPMQAYAANVQQQGSNISVRFASIPFPVAMHWLESLHAIHVSQLSAKRSGKPPNVRLQVQFHS